MSFGAGSFGERTFGEPSAASPGSIYLEEVTDALLLASTPTSTNIYLRSVAESLLLQEGTCHCDFVTLISDAWSLTDATTWDLRDALIDIINLQENLIQDSTYNPLFDENLAFADAVREAFAEMLSDGLVLTDVVTYVRHWDGQLRELLNFADIANSTEVYNKLISDALALTDLASHPERETLSDGLSLVDTLTGLAEMYGTLVDSIVSADTSSYIAVFSGSLSDVLVSTDAASHTSIVLALLEDDFRFVVWQGDDQTAYTGYVMNPKVGGLTEYQNYNFNSIGKIAGQYYGASRTGLYLLEGADDAGTDIDVAIKFGAFDPGTGMKSRVQQAYIGVRADGKIIFKTFADDGKERWYETQALHDDLQTQRAKLGRGVKSRYWQFELVNRDGGSIDLEQFEFLPIVLTRRV